MVLREACQHSHEGDEDAKAGGVLMSRARMQIQDWRIPKPMLFSVGRGVSMDRKGRAATRESVDGNEMQIPPPRDSVDG